MWYSEKLLYLLAKLMYRSEVAHSSEMKSALAEPQQYHSYRSDEIDQILSAAARYGVEIAGKTVLDLGCNDGAISVGIVEQGRAEKVVGIDIDTVAIEKAKSNHETPKLSFQSSTTDRLPLEDEKFDVILCYDVFEHVSQPAPILTECYRVLKPGGKMLIGTWGWYHPYAPHLWATMPVPWVQVFFSEKTIMRACRLVYESSWYVPNMHDLDQDGKKLPNRYLLETIPDDYLNKLLIRDYRRLFSESPFDFQIHPQAFGSKWARWTRCLLNVPWLSEFITAYIWVELSKQTSELEGGKSTNEPLNSMTAP